MKKPYEVMQTTMAVLALGTAAIACSGTESIDSEGAAAENEAAEVDISDIATVEQEIGEAGCATEGADYTSMTAVFQTSSPRSYTHENCSKAYIVDSGVSSGGYAGAPGYGGYGGAPGGSNLVTVFWNDEFPTNRADCEAVVLRADLYDMTQGSRPRIGQRFGRGLWWNGVCRTPYARFTDAPFAYRIVATAQTNFTIDAPTRSVKVRDY